MTKALRTGAAAASAVIAMGLLSVGPAGASEQIIEAPASGDFLVETVGGESPEEVVGELTGEDATDISGPAFDGALANLSAGDVADLEADPRVLNVERNEPVRVSDALPGKRALASGRSDVQSQASGPAWGLDRIDQRLLPLDHSYQPVADGTGTNVYVLDSGIDLDNAEFGSRIGRSAYVASIGDSPGDCSGHGTHVAGTVGSSTYGVAKQTTLHSVRVLDCNGAGTTATVVAGLNWVAQHAGPRSIVNLSLGTARSDAVDSAVAALSAAGVVTVAAAGNDGDDACSHSPAAEPSAVTVGALDRTDAEADFSNTGSCVDIWAPGVAITSVRDGGGTSVMDGTSMATPHVAGALAVLWSRSPGLSASAASRELLDQATTGAVSFGPWGSYGAPNRSLYVPRAASGTAATDPTPAVAEQKPGQPTSPKVRVKGRRAVLRWREPSSGTTTGYIVTARSAKTGKKSTRRVSGRRLVLKRLAKGKHVVLIRAYSAQGRGKALKVSFRR